MFRQLRQQGVPIAASGLAGGSLLERHLERELGNLQRLYNQLDPVQLTDTAGLSAGHPGGRGAQ
jgi:hypothetical protein